MRNLTETEKKTLLERIDNLGPEHWDKVKKRLIDENDEFLKHGKALSVSRSKLDESFDI